MTFYESVSNPGHKIAIRRYAPTPIRTIDPRTYGQIQSTEPVFKLLIAAIHHESDGRKLIPYPRWFDHGGALELRRRASRSWPKMRRRATPPNLIGAKQCGGDRETEGGLTSKDCGVRSPAHGAAQNTGGGQDPTSNWCTTGGSLRQERSRTRAGSTRGLPRLPTGDPSLPYARFNHDGGDSRIPNAHELHPATALCPAHDRRRTPSAVEPHGGSGGPIKRWRKVFGRPGILGGAEVHHGTRRLPAMAGERRRVPRGKRGPGQGLYIRGLNTSPSGSRNDPARSALNFREDASGDLLGFLPTLANTEKRESDQRDSASSELYGAGIRAKIARLLRCCRGRRAAC
jgi:hypothetical protein